MDSYIKFIGSDGFQRKRRDKKLTHGQAKAYRDFSNNFDKNAIESQIQEPINTSFTKQQQINLYQAKYQDKTFTTKQFKEETNINPRELSRAVNNGKMERVSKGVYRYK